MKFKVSSWQRWFFSTTVVMLVLVGVIAIGWLATSFKLADDQAQDGPEQPGVAPLIVSWQTATWEPGYTVTRSFVGRVEARQISDVGFEISGKIATVSVNEGDAIEVGQILAMLDTERLNARRDELRALRDQAQARLDLAELILERITQFRKSNAATQLELDEANQEKLAAKAQLRQAEAAVTTIEVDIEKATLRSPFTAVVARRFVDDGRVVPAGTPVLQLLERVSPQVRIGVGGDSIDEVEVGQSLDVQISERTVKGTVDAILPVRDRTGRGVDVLINLEVTLNGIRQGDLARVQIERYIDDRGFWLPKQALTQGVRGLWSVYTLEPVTTGQGEAVLRQADIELLHTETDHVFVRGPFNEATPIMATGQHRVAPGMTVRRGPALVSAPTSGSASQETR